MPSPCICRLLFLLSVAFASVLPVAAQKRTAPRPKPKPAPPVVAVPAPIDPERDVLPRAQLALQLADLIYFLPDLDNKKTTLQAREYFAKFKEKMPSDLTLAMSESDPKTGLRVAAFKPKNPKTSKTHLYVTIAGTEGVRDGMADFSFGRSQCQHLLELIAQLFATQKLPPNPEILITGHSLGGGLAQAVAWFLEENLPPRKIQPRLWLITWNAFGAQELIRKQDKSFNPDQVQLTHVAHYFVRGEPVSKLGTHLGPTFELVLENSGKKSRKWIPIKLDGFNKHRIETITAMVEEDPMILLKAEPVKTERKFYSSLLSGLMNKTSGVTKHLPGFTFKVSSKDLPEALARLYQDLAEKEKPTREDREFFDWLETTTARLLPDLETKMKRTFNELIAVKDQALLKFYDLKVVKATKTKAAELLRLLKKEFE